MGREGDADLSLARLRSGCQRAVRGILLESAENGLKGVEELH